MNYPIRIPICSNPVGQMATDGDFASSFPETRLLPCPVCVRLASPPAHRRNDDEWIGQVSFDETTQEHKFVCGHVVSAELVNA